MTLLVKKLDDRAIIPTRGSAEAIGADLYALHDVLVKHNEVAVVRTGIAVAFPPAFYARIAPRSGLAARWGIDTLAGVVDADYRGEIIVLLTKHTPYPYIIQAGERVAQLILERASLSPVIEVAELPSTTRGEKGFGSSGV